METQKTAKTGWKRQPRGFVPHSIAELEGRGWEGLPAFGLPPAGGIPEQPSGETACQLCHISTKPLPTYQKRNPSISYYKRGVIVNTPIVAAGRSNTTEAKRGAISGLSDKARNRLIFLAANAPGEWRYMITLTYPADPTKPALGLPAFLQMLRRSDGDAYLWVREYTEAKRLHYHVSLSDCGLSHTLASEGVKEYRSRGTVCDGRTASRIQEHWIHTLRKSGEFSAEQMTRCSAFNRGGIIEPFRSPEAAARYLAKEFSKREQKIPPPGLEGGRWWGASTSLKPRAFVTTRMDVEEQSSRFGRIPDLEHARKQGHVIGI